MTALQLWRKILAVLLAVCILICAVLFAKEIFFQEQETENRYYSIRDVNEEEQRACTEISFVDSDTGFQVALGDGDCFAEFYKAEAGQTLSAEIEVSNRYDSPVSVILNAACEPEQEPAVRELLSSYTELKITNEKGLTFYSGKVWNEAGETQNISLGTYAVNTSKKLRIEITVSEEASEEAVAACDRVIWVFSGLNSESSIGAPPSTLFSARIFLLLSAAILCVILILTVIKKVKSRWSGRH